MDTIEQLNKVKEYCGRLEISLRVDGKWNFFATSRNALRTYRDFDGSDFEDGVNKLSNYMLEEQKN